jgi:hypothetical protein
MTYRLSAATRNLRVSPRAARPALVLAITALAMAPALAAAQGHVGDTIPLAPGAQRTMAAVAALADTGNKAAVRPDPRAERALRAGDRVSAGDTVRLFSGSREVIRGILVRADTLSFEMLVPSHPDTISFPRASVSRAQVQRGDRQRGVSAVGTGALVGFGIGAMLAALALTEPDHSDGLAPAFAAAAVTTTTVIGTAIGALVALTSTEQWLTFDPATLRIALRAR